MNKIWENCDWGDKEDEDLLKDFDIHSESEKESHNNWENEQSNPKKRKIDSNMSTPDESLFNQENESKNVESNKLQTKNASSCSKRIIECLEEGSAKKDRKSPQSSPFFKKTESFSSMQALPKDINTKNRGNEVRETLTEKVEFDVRPGPSGLGKDFRKYTPPEVFSLSTSSSPKFPKFTTPETCFKKPKPKEASDSPRPMLVRKFPGPAGLLPDRSNSSISASIEILREIEKEESKEDFEKSNLGDLCSQNTKNLFTEGAWKLMLKDLPPNFLKDDIASIKKNAKPKCRMNKVPYLAVMLKSINYGENSPLVILKDMSDEITGNLHCEIRTLYPDALECGSVFLLQNVGFYTTTITGQCQALILAKNIVAIYNDKERKVTTPFFQSLTKSDAEECQDWGECFDEDFDLEEIMSKHCDKAKPNSKSVVEKMDFDDDWSGINDLFNDENEDVNMGKDKGNSETKTEVSRTENQESSKSSQTASNFLNHVVESPKVSNRFKALFDSHDDDELLSQLDI